MNSEEKDKIFDRLIAINMEISNGTVMVPDPSYINRKIGECHIYIGEVEKFYINVSKEISVIQRALNNARAKYESEKDNLLTTKETIRSLPSIVEREAMANSLLKDSIREIQNYENELSDLNNLFKAINHKNKNLIRANQDIKSQMRMVEAQVRLGSPTDAVAKGFMEEMKKGISGDDSFKDAFTEVEEIKTADPTTPLDVKSLLGDLGVTGDEEVTQSDIDEEELQEEEPQEEEPDSNNLSDDVVKEAEASIRQEMVIDLESVLEPIPKATERSEPAKEDKEPMPVPVQITVPAEDEKINEQIKNPDVKIKVDDLDLDMLLKQY
jgi:hypothetical protein